MDKKTENKKTIQPKDDFAGIDFGDKRLTKRLQKTVENLTKSAKKSILSSGGGRSEAKAFYRLLSNEKFDFYQVSAMPPEAAQTKNENKVYRGKSEKRVV